MKIYSYENLDVYKLAFDLALKVHEISTLPNIPKFEQFGGLADQIRRSSKGVCANLGEGLSKHMSHADERKFISIAIGSAEETRVWLSFAERLKYIDTQKAEEFREDYVRVCKMLFGLMESRKRED